MKPPSGDSTPAVRRELWLLAAYATANLVLLLVLRPAPNADWATAWWPLESWGQDLYDHPYRYSPLLLPVIGLVVFGGPLALGIAHLMGVMLLQPLGRWLMWLVGFSVFFWVDLIVGNVFTFVAVAAAFAIAGPRAGGLWFIGLTLLMPRPVQIPLAMWLLVHRPDIRRPAAVIIAAQAVALLASGLAEEWIVSLFGSASLTYESFSLGPGRIFGNVWILIGIPLATLMVWRGTAAVAALAGLVMSPFLLPQYLLMGVVALPFEIGWRRAESTGPVAVSTGVPFRPGRPLPTIRSTFSRVSGKAFIGREPVQDPVPGVSSSGPREPRSSRRGSRAV
jgi:hypothetical protein